MRGTKSWSSVLVWVILWIVAIALAAVVGARLVGWNDLEIFAILDALTWIVFLPAWPIMIVAMFRRRKALALVGGLIVIAQVTFVAPELLAATPLAVGPETHGTLRIFDANVSYRNHAMAGYALQIRRDAPDLVVLEEASPTDKRQLELGGALRSLPYQTEVSRSDSRGLVIASRYPLGPAVVSSIYWRGLGKLAYMVRTAVKSPEGAIQLWAVHTTAPVDPSAALWSAELDRIKVDLSQRLPARLLMVGDFNATWGNQQFRAILATGVTDGAAARGEAAQMTWPQTWWAPPFVRIDHVLTGPGVVVTSIHTAPGPGSDHRSLTASVAFH